MPANTATAANALPHQDIPVAEPIHPRVAERFDLGIKFALAERILHSAVSDVVVFEYLNHIYKWNGFSEHGSDKKGAGTFLETFGSIVKALHEGRRYVMPPIPVSASGAIQNGAHRLAASLATGITPAFELLQGQDHRWDYRYFRQFSSPRGAFGRTTLLKMLFRNLSMWRGLYRFAIVFPGACIRDGGEVAMREIGKHGTVLWDESFTCPRFFLKYLLLNCYPGEDWLGLGRGAPGLQNKLGQVAAADRENQPLRVIAFLPDKGVDVGALKGTIRGHYGIAHSALHISDSERDTSSVAMAYCSTISDVNPLKNLDYDAPSLRALADIGRDLPGLISHRERCLLVGSAVLEMFGGRRANDLDWLGLGLPGGGDRLASHNDYIFLYESSLEQMLDGLEDKYFLFGVPLLTPRRVMRFKELRSEIKDQQDLARFRPSASA